MTFALFYDIVFFQISAFRSTAGINYNVETLATIDNSDYYPSTDAVFNTLEFQGELGSRVQIPANQGDIKIYDLENKGDTNFRVTVNGWYYKG